MAIAVCTVAPITTFAADRPNIVLILADDMSWYGTATQLQQGFEASAGKTRRTPSINTLAKQGMTFSRAFAPAGICAPSRCSIQTVMTTARTRFSGNGNFGVASREVTYDGRRNKGQLMLEPSPLGNLDSNQRTIAEQLKPLGYATAHIGKWHIYDGGPGAHGYDLHDGEMSIDDVNSDDPQDLDHIFGMTEKAKSFIEDQASANDELCCSSVPVIQSDRRLHRTPRDDLSRSQNGKALCGGRPDSRLTRLGCGPRIVPALTPTLDHNSQVSRKESPDRIHGLSDQGARLGPTHLATIW